MKLGWSLLVLSLALSWNIRSQTIHISEEYELRNDYSYDILGRYGDRIIMMRNRLDKVYLQFFDNEMNLRNEKEFKLEDRRYEIIGTVPGANYFSIIYLYRQKGDVHLALQQFDGYGVLIDSTHILKILVDKFISPKFDLVYSEDRTKALLYTETSDNRLELSSIDLDKKQVLSEQVFKFEDFAASRLFDKAIITNSGNSIIILSRTELANRNEEPDIQIYEGLVGSDLFIPYNYYLQENYSLLTNSFTWDEINQCLVGAGLYAIKNLSRAEGLFSFRQCGTTADSQLVYTPLSEHVLSELYGKSFSEVKGIPNLEMEDLVLREDGGFLAFSEIRKRYSRRNYLQERSIPGNTAFVSDFQYEDVLVFSIHPDGKTHWVSVLHKKQYSHDDNAVYSSYFIFRNPARIRLIYNDEISRENTVSEYVIQGNGHTVRSALMNTEYQRLQLRFKDAVQISPTEFIIPSQRQLRLNLVKVNYQ